MRVNEIDEIEGSSCSSSGRELREGEQSGEEAARRKEKRRR